VSLAAVGAEEEEVLEPATEAAATTTLRGMASSTGWTNVHQEADLLSDYRRRASPAAAVEYDEYEGADDFAETRRTGSSTSNRTSRPQPPPKSTPRAAKPAEKPKEVNLFDFGDDEPAAPTPAAGSSASQNILGGDGESLYRKSRSLIYR
jgi:hypothetical protein